MVVDVYIYKFIRVYLQIYTLTDVGSFFVKNV